MMLMTRDNFKALPRLYANESTPDPVAQVKFFTPTSNWTWYATEGSWVDANGKAMIYEGIEKPAGAADFLFFGLVQGFEEELGYFSLQELSSVKGPLGLGIERDRHFRPQPLSALRKDV
jgi:hypothetical protein